MDAIERPVALSLSEQIARHLSQAITAGHYKPGESLGEQAISDLFRVSRAPVREALRILERDGVVQITPRHGARVTELSHTELLEAYEVRATLFGLAAGRFAASPPAEPLAKLRRSIEALVPLVESDSDGTTYNQEAGELARIIIDHSGNTRLIVLIRTLDYQVARYRRLGLSTPEMRQASLTNWRTLLAALEARDTAGAERIGRAMVIRTRDAAAPFFDGDPAGR